MLRDNFKYRRPIALTLLAAACALVSCIRDEYRGPDPNLPTRTVVVYLAGDNDLAELAEVAEELRRAWSYTGNRCLIYYDAADAAPVLLSLRGGCTTWPTPWIETVAEYAEENSASAEVFGRVVRDAVRMYPADSYGLIYASHASGWLPEGTLSDPRRTLRSIGLDRTPATLGSGGAEMELADFAAAIPDRQFDFIVFEACLMAGVEVAYALRDKTDYILASSAEMLVPGLIPVYAEAFGALMQTRLSVERSLIRLGKAYYDYMNARSGAERSATVSILKTGAMDLLAARVGDVLRNRQSAAVTSDMTELQHFDRPGSYGESSVAPRYFDLEQYVETLAPQTYVDSFREVLGQAVVWKAATPEFMKGRNGFVIERHSGLTTYVEQAEFPELNEAYRRTAWYSATHAVAE